MKAADQHKVLDIIKKTVTNDTSWEAISQAVKAEMTIKNWMSVRGILQYMMDNNMIARIKDVHSERYTTFK